MTIGSGIRKLRRRTVVVHTRDDQSIRGVLTEAYHDCLVLAEPRYLGEAKAEEIKGSAVVPRENVAWLQVVEG